MDSLIELRSTFILTIDFARLTIDLALRMPFGRSLLLMKQARCNKLRTPKC